MRRVLFPAALAATGPGGGLLAGTMPRAPAVAQESIYGGNLMTGVERRTYQQRLRNAGTPQEKRQIRARHRQMIQERARVQGVQPNDPSLPIGAGVVRPAAQATGLSAGQGKGQPEAERFGVAVGKGAAMAQPLSAGTAEGRAPKPKAKPKGAPQGQGMSVGPELRMGPGMEMGPGMGPGTDQGPGEGTDQDN